jgi:hypothetical protein
LLRILEKSFEPEFSKTFIAEILGIVTVAIFAVSWLKKMVKQKDSDGINGHWKKKID